MLRMVPTVLLLAVLGLGCDEGLLDQLPRVQVMAACIVPPAGTIMDPGFSDVAYTVSGGVSDAGAGDDGRGCFDAPKIGWGDGASSSTQWLEVVDDRGLWTVGMRMPGLELPGEGTEVAIDFHYAFGGFSPLIGNLVIEDARGTVAWIGRGGDTPDLVLPAPIQSVRPGETVYRSSEECGQWEAYEIEVRTESDDVTLEYGESEDHDGGIFFHGGYRHSTGKSQCPDWFVADVELGWRRE